MSCCKWVIWTKRWRIAKEWPLLEIQGVSTEVRPVKKLPMQLTAGSSLTLLHRVVDAARESLA